MLINTDESDDDRNNSTYRAQAILIILIMGSTFYTDKSDNDRNNNTQIYYKGELTCNSCENYTQAYYFLDCLQ